MVKRDQLAKQILDDSCKHSIVVDTFVSLRLCRRRQKMLPSLRHCRLSFKKWQMTMQQRYNRVLTNKTSMTQCHRRQQIYHLRHLQKMTTIDYSCLSRKNLKSVLRCLQSSVSWHAFSCVNNALAVGPIRVWFDYPSFDEMVKMYPFVQRGGHSVPSSCLARNRVAIIIPYRCSISNMKFFKNITAI